MIIEKGLVALLLDILAYSRENCLELRISSIEYDPEQRINWNLCFQLAGLVLRRVTVCFFWADGVFIDLVQLGWRLTAHSYKYLIEDISLAIHKFFYYDEFCAISHMDQVLGINTPQRIATTIINRIMAMPLPIWLEVKNATFINLRRKFFLSSV